MHADYAVELGPEDEVLEFPWSAAEKNLRYYDLKSHPELLPEIEEARQLPALRKFLEAVNSSRSNLETAKCDVWWSMDINPEEEIFGCNSKFGSYIDLLFSETSDRFLFEKHETFAKDVSELLKRAPEMPTSADFLLRRCYYHCAEGRTEQGYYITFYLFGYGDDEDEARIRWAIGLDLVRNALLQLSSSI